MKGSVEGLTLQALCARKKKSSLVFTVRQRLCTEQKIKKSCVSSRWHLSLVYFSQSFHCKPARMGELLEPLSALCKFSKADGSDSLQAQPDAEQPQMQLQMWPLQLTLAT